MPSLVDSFRNLFSQSKPRRSRAHYIPYKARRFGLGNISDEKSFGSKWPVQATPARTYVSRKQRQMVARSRDVIMKNDYARQFMRMFVQNVIGEDGIRFQASARKHNGTLDSDLNETLQENWMEWSEEINCDLSGEDSFVDMQQACATSLCTDGEFFIRMHEDKSKYGLKLQILDAQRCSPVETRKFQYARNQALYNGILFDRPTMKPIAYLFGGEHTNDNYYDDSSQKYDRIPAEDVLHGYLKERIGQFRGLPVIHTALERTFSLDRYEEAALQSARIGAGKAGFFEVDPNVGGAEEATEDEEIEIDPNSFTELPPGWTIGSYDPTYPHEMYDDFIRSGLRGMASGMGVSYHDLSNDLTDVNYSSIRQGSLKDRYNWKLLQKWMVRKKHKKIYKRWVVIQLQRGNLRVGRRVLDLTDLKKCLEVTWTGRRWEWIDPKSEAIANTEQIRNMLISPSQVIRDLGRDPEEVWRQVAQDIESMTAAGIPEPLVIDIFANKITQYYEEKEVENDNSSTPKKRS